MQAMAARQPAYQEGFVVVDGVRVYYLHAGQGRPMLLIHGLVGSSQNWRNNIDALAEHASVYAIDLANMGRSQRVGGLDPGLVATSHRLIAVMNALNLPEADIVAHSHGGAIALMLAALHPERVRRLILFAPANPYCRSNDPVVLAYSTPWGGMLARFLPYLPVPVQRTALGAMYGGSNLVVDRCLHEVVEGLRNRETLSHVLRIVRCWFEERAKLKAALGRLKRRRMLLVWGDHDHTVSFKSGIMLKHKLHGADLVEVPGGSHAVFEEMPEEANRIVLDWLERHPWSTPLEHASAKVISIAKSERNQSALGGMAAD
jgi:4,5:9,10-diseco-3-hydroxy-5,9,17-trioxoandrosta-1(10),2-diene-4-oate hydrolase